MAATRWGIALVLIATILCGAVVPQLARGQNIDELMRNNTPPGRSGDGSDGWAALGDVLSGGVERRAKEAGARALEERLELENSIAHAQYLNRLVETRNLLTEAWKAMGIDPAVAGAVAMSYVPDETDQVVLLTVRQSGFRKGVQDAIHALVDRNYKLANQLALATVIVFEEQKRAAAESTPAPASPRYWENPR